jgi:hypothetical protein
VLGLLGTKHAIESHVSRCGSAVFHFFMLWLYQSPVLSELWPIHVFCRSCGVPALRNFVTRECLNACSPAPGIPSRLSNG